MSPPSVSVIIPTYNFGRFIDESIKSVLAQTYEDFEVIVVDDGSTDDTRERVQAFAPRVKYVYQSNGGVALARNTGLQHSRGRYLSFLDADDVWLPHKLERQVDILETRNDVGYVYGWCAFTDESGHPLEEARMPVSEGNVLRDLLTGCFMTPSMGLVKRECLDRVGAFDPALVPADDWDIFLRIAAVGYAFACVPEILMHYRIHPRQQTQTTPVSKMVQASSTILDRFFSRYPPSAEAEELSALAYQNLYVNAALDHYWQNEGTLAEDMLLRALRFEPRLLEKPGFFRSLAYMHIPFGYRTPHELTTRLDRIIPDMEEILTALFRNARFPYAARSRRRIAWSNLYVAIATLCGSVHRWSQASIFLVRALLTYPPVPIRAFALRIGNHLLNGAGRRTSVIGPPLPRGDMAATKGNAVPS